MKDRLTKAANHTAFPISLLVIICLVAGIFSFRDYGMSWDEPLFYKYADAIPYAYSLSARLSGNFNILKAYGPSETDHMMYGPAYILIARPFVLLSMFLTGADQPSGWHLINFLFFLIGALFLYLLSLRWMNQWAAFSAVLLFVTQPLFWGHAFINPKDIPFTTLFIIAIYAGYKMVDSATPPRRNDTNPGPLPRYWSWVRVLLWVFFSLMLIASIVTVAFNSQIKSLIPEIIRSVYDHPDSIGGKIFLLLTSNPSGSTVEAYIVKGQGLFAKLPSILFIFTIILGLSAFLTTYKTELLRRSYQSIRIDMSLSLTIFAGITLGLLTAIRILGPLAGILVSLFFLLRFGRRAISGIFYYGLIAFITMLIFWPYLWDSPIAGLIAVLKHSADNAQVVPVLFNGLIVSSNALPVSYFPTMLGLTLTEPVWILFFFGAGLTVYMLIKRRLDWKEILPIGLWFLLPLFYVILFTPPQYDGFRHFIFIMPPVFITIGLLFNKLFEINRIKWINLAIVFVLVLPGIMGIVRLHPYEYTYYNYFIGGTKGAFRKYETDYWLTCYKEVIDELNNSFAGQQKLFVYKNLYLASQYAGKQFSMEQFNPNSDTTSSGDLLLMSNRSNYDQLFHRDDPSLFTINREGVTFCSVKLIK